MDKTPTHLDLFSGIGGFALAAWKAGFRTIAFCEIDKYCQKVLRKNFGAEIVADSKQSGVSGGDQRRPRSQGKEMGEREDRESASNQSGDGSKTGSQKVLAKNFASDAGSKGVLQYSEFGDAGENGDELGRVLPNGSSQSEEDKAGNLEGSPRIVSNIFDLDGRAFRGVDLVTGGFPCQPFSVAGKRGGTSDDRDLWPEMFRVVRELAEANREIGKSTWMLGENVAGLESMEFQRHALEVGSQDALWDSAEEVHICCESTLLLDARIRADLESAGFQVGLYVIPACGVDAKHRRNRLWIVAHAQCDGRSGRSRRGSVAPAKGKKQTGPNDAFDVTRTGQPPAAGRNVSHTSGRDGRPRRSRGSQHSGERSPQSIRPHQQKNVGNAGRTGSQGLGREHQLREGGEEIKTGGTGNVDNSKGVDARGLPVGAQPQDTGSGIGSEAMADTGTPGLPQSGSQPGEQTPASGLGTEYCRGQDESEWFLESGMGRVANDVPNRVDRLKGLGNAIVPPVAYEILRCIRQLI